MATTRAILTQRDRAILGELEELVRETYLLWDEDWVGFSWRNYTFDHVLRVRNLARTIAEQEGGDLRSLEFAATLHDITKSYDGEILTRDGKRILDADGFWITAKLKPARQNRVTVLYERLGLSETVHHYSGSRIATALLREYGYDEAFCAAVREIVLAHLKPLPTSSPAALSLYDADTIDANIGLPAFYRNVRITVHRLEQDLRRRGDDLDTYLANHLRPFLTGYLCEKIPPWIHGKRSDFLARLTTDTGRAIANRRLERLLAQLADLIAELEDFETNVRRGRLAIVRRFIEHRQNPSLSDEISELAAGGAIAAALTDGARAFLEAYRREIAGVE